MTQRIVLPILLLCAILTVGACTGTSAPSQFYLLTPSAEHNMASGEQAKKLTVEIGPITLPQYLDRPQIVTRSGSNSLKVDEFHRWGEPLKDSFNRALIENISTLLSTDLIFMYPMHTLIKIDYQVLLTVTRFDRDENGRIVLNARWMVFPKGEQSGGGSYVAKESSISETASTEDYNATVAAMSAAVGKLSQEIAQTILASEH